MKIHYTCESQGQVLNCQGKGLSVLESQMQLHYHTVICILLTNIYGDKFNCRLKALLYLLFWTFQYKSGKPQPIRTKFVTHAQVEDRQRSQNCRRYRLSGGEMGG